MPDDRTAGIPPAPIRVVPYDDGWPAAFERVAADLRTALASVPVRAIEHVGSTSVPCLAAKPVLDIDVVVGPADVEPAVAALVASGYVDRGTLGIPDRRALWSHDEPARHVYVVVAGCLALRNHLAVRDVLRGDAALREEYAATKRALARSTSDPDAYGAGKSGVLGRILAAAGLTDGDIDAVAAVNRPPDRRSGSQDALGTVNR